MTLCELEVAHLSPPMECRPIKQKVTITPAKRRNCVEWAFFPRFICTVPPDHDLGRWLGVPSLGLATLGTSESQVSSVIRVRATVSFMTRSARMCHAYQQLNDIGMSVQVPPEKVRNEQKNL
jgi:hypothetical protein